MKKVYTLFRTLLVLSIFTLSLSNSLQAQCPDTCTGVFRTNILLDTLVDCATGTVDAISGDIQMGQCQSPAGDNCHHFRLIRDSFSTVTSIRFDAGLGANCTGSINTIYVGANGFCDSIPGGGGGGVPFTVSYPSNCFSTGSWEVLELDVWLCDNSGSQVSMCNACAGDLCPNIDADLYDGCSNCTNNFTGSTYPLDALFTPITTPGGTWELIATPGTGYINSTSLVYFEPGCYQVAYTVVDPMDMCTESDTAYINIPEGPTPAFDLTQDVCWDGMAGSIELSPYYNGNTLGTYGTIEYAWTASLLSGAGPIPTFDDTTLQQPTISIEGAGEFEICLAETITTPTCGSILPVVCSDTICHILTVFETSVVVDPSWTPFGPLCADDSRAYLGASSGGMGCGQVTGTCDGVFTGEGVVEDPAGSGQYYLDPTLVNIPGGTEYKDVNVCYTVNNLAGCTAVECHDIRVYAGVSITLVGDTLISCQPVNANGDIPLFALNLLLRPGSSLGGNWALISGPGSVTNGILSGSPGCYQVQYTASSFDGADGACVASGSMFVMFTENTDPDFSMADEVCWDGVSGSITLPILYNGGTIGTGGTVNYSWTANLLSGAGPVPTFNNSMIQQPTLNIVGAGEFEICLTEDIDYPDCGSLTGLDGQCSNTVCHRLTVHETSIEVIPNWRPFGPLCEDDTRVYLGAASTGMGCGLVTGDCDGVFTGEGVVEDPAGSGQYYFDPTMVIIGLDGLTYKDVNICYTVNNNAGCTAVECHDVRVFEEANVSLIDGISYVCQEPNINGFIPLMDLSILINPGTTPGGTWTRISGPGNVINGFLDGQPGCYRLRYSVSSFPGADGACVASQDIDFRLTENPQPGFDLAEEVCWDGLAGSVTLPILNTSQTFGTNATINYLWTVTGGPGAVPTFNNNMIFQPSLTVQGAGDFEVCVTESLDYPACGGIQPFDDHCAVTTCHTLTIHETSIEVIPTWSPLGLFCEDDMRVYLGASTAGMLGCGLVTGDCDGVFTGEGVTEDPPGSGQYYFNPTLVNVIDGSDYKDVNVCYTVNNGAGCTATECHDIRVYEGVTVNLFSDFIACEFARGDGRQPLFDLSILQAAGTTPGGTWSLISGPGNVVNGFISGVAGCYEVAYSVSAYPGADGDCSETDTTFVRLTERPIPAFDLAEEACWDGVPGSITLPITYDGQTFGLNATLNYSWTVTGGPGTVPTFNNSTIQEPTLTVQGAGVFEVCLTENLDYPMCGGLAPLSGYCSVTTCHTLTIHETSVEVIPTWTPFGPVCEDDMRVYLGANTSGMLGCGLVTGTCDGVFTGEGVVEDPDGSGEYYFDPTLVSILVGTEFKDISICYTANNNAGCTATECHDIRVYHGVEVNLILGLIACELPREFGFQPLFDLTTLEGNNTTSGGTWRIISSPAVPTASGSFGSVLNNTLSGPAGCYELEYSVSAFPGADGDCMEIDTTWLLLQELPQPAFDFTEEVCWDGVPGSITLPTLYDGETYSLNATLTYSWVANLLTGVGPVPTFSDATAQQPDITVQGPGEFEICLTETLSYPACGPIGPQSACQTTTCHIFTVHETSEEVLASWTPIGPFCEDDAREYLGAASMGLGCGLVTGNCDGVFTGEGVTEDPDGSGQYYFNPTLVNVPDGTDFKDVSVCYTANNNAGCTATECHDIRVYESVTVNLRPFFAACQHPRENGFQPLFDLEILLNPGTTLGGTWTLISGPPVSPTGVTSQVINGFISGVAGCYEVAYTVSAWPGADGACTETDTTWVRLTELPTPAFDMAEEVCWDGVAGSITIPTLYDGETYGFNATLDFAWVATIISGAGPVPTFSDATIAQPTLTVQGPGVFEICLTESLTYPQCGPPMPPALACETTTCHILTVHETSEEVLPFWEPVGPFCEDDMRVYLGAASMGMGCGQVFGDCDGVFTGEGVTEDPNGSGQYYFNPTLVDVPAGTEFKDVSVCYTVNNNAGCTATECHNIRVYEGVYVDLLDAIIECEFPRGAAGRQPLFDLAILMNDSTTLGGTWRLISGPGEVINGFISGVAGCYELEYSVSRFDGADGSCTETDTAFLRLTERPTPDFDVAEEICWDGVDGSVTIPTIYSGSTFAYNATLNYTWTVNTVSGGPAPTFNNATIQEPTITVRGAGVFEICLTEDLDYPVCGPIQEQLGYCGQTVCHTLTIHETSEEVIPTWIPLGPFCEDDAREYLGAASMGMGCGQVTGNCDGVFTGEGVVEDPDGSGEYYFDPMLVTLPAGVEFYDVNVCYTVNNNAGCTGTECHDIRVYAGVDATIQDIQIECVDEPHGAVSLTALFTSSTSEGGTFTLVSGPASGFVNGGVLIYQEAGCYEIAYEVEPFVGADGACTDSDTAFVLITEEPQPYFDMQDQVCFSDGDAPVNLTSVYVIRSYPFGTLSREFIVLLDNVNGATVTVDPNSGLVTITDDPGSATISGTAIICMTEELDYPSCGSFPGTNVGVDGDGCSDVICRIVRVEDGTAIDASFTASNTEPCPGDVVTFTAATSGGVFTGVGVTDDGNGMTASLQVDTCGIYAVTYTISSPNGCTNSFTMNIQTDRTPPTITAPMDATVECDGTGNLDAMNAWAQSFTASDNCQFSARSMVYDRRSGCSPLVGTYVFEFIAEDTCGNVARDFASFTIEDTTPPEITTDAQNLVVECDGSGNTGDILAWLNDNGGAEADDLCDTVLWSNDFTGDLGDYCGQNNLTVTFTAQDRCGNTSTTSATIQIFDDTDPVWLIEPVDLLLECDDVTDEYQEIQAWLARAGDGVAIDSCSVTVTFGNDFTGLTDGCSGNTGIAVVTFTATDVCGNTASSSATVEVIDTYGPEIVSPAKDTIVLCDGSGNTTALDMWLANNGGAIAEDRCSGVESWRYVQLDIGQLCGGASRTGYEFFAIDSCGNESNGTVAYFEIANTGGPIFLVDPVDEVVDCDGNGNADALDAWLEDNGGAEATTEGCIGGPLFWERDLVEELDQCSNTTIYTYRFTAIDTCGNESWREADFVVQDTTAPVITPGMDQIVECDDNNANNDDELIDFLETRGGSTADDNCSDVVNWTNNFDGDNWIEECGNTRYVDVTFYATDDCGNVDSVTLRFGTMDLSAPEFQNCPRLPIVENAETGHCDAYVNFSAPFAIDNCTDTVQINQIDNTGLNSGDRFPVGTTILIFEAVDDCDNRDTCSYKIIVNDYWEAPRVTCRDSVDQINDLDECGADVFSLAPIVADSCADNIAVQYVIVNEEGDTTKKGIGDASGSFFDVGTNELIYCVQDQPVVLITEVTQALGNFVGNTSPVPGYFDGDLVTGDYVEIMNFGPAAVDMNCVSLEVVGGQAVDCYYTITGETILQPGETVVIHVGDGVDDPANNFFNMGCVEADTDEGRGYVLSLYNHVIDVFATNGFDPSNLGTVAVVEGTDFIGTTPDHECYGSYYRNCLPDRNLASDWVLAESCEPATLGSVNPTLQDFVFAWNGTTTSMQSTDPGKTVCTTVVTVRDVEVPNCISHDSINYTYDGRGLGVEINPGECFTASINVAEDLLIDDINVLNLRIEAENVYDIEVTLISPEGKEVKLIENACTEDDSDINISLDDNGSSQDFASCNPLGGGLIYAPVGVLKDYFQDNMMGTWTLEIENNSCDRSDVASLTNWELQLLGILPYTQLDTILPNDPGVCGAEFCWIHPILEDNCCEGTITVEYIPVTPGVEVPDGGTVDIFGVEVCEMFDVGRTLVKYTLVDQYGNMNMCSFEVKVDDVEDPIITNCPGDQIIHLDCGLCDVVWSYNYKATDNCGIDTIMAFPPNGSLFPIGDTTICIVAVDSSGNTDTCKYTLSVKEYIPLSNELSCVNDINLSLGPDCIAALNADMILEGCNHRCYDNYILQVTEGCGNGIPGPAHSDTFDLDDVGKCFTVTVIDPVSGNSCWGCVCIEEKLLPELQCPADDTVSCIQPLHPSYLGYAEVLTCEGSAAVTYVDSIVDFGDCEDYMATLYRKWTVTDDEGNKVRCTQTILIEAFDLADVRFPRSYDNLDLPALSCGDAKYDKDVSPHIIDFPFCVDGYLLDSLNWLRTGGDPTIIDPTARDLSGDRLPKVLGWNDIETGPSAGYPSPFPVYYDAHPQWQFFGVCWAPEQQLMWSGTGTPTLDGISIYENSGYCMLSIRYDDELYDICDDGYEILRYWKVRDMCQPAVWGVNPIIHIQTIKVLDREGPEITYPSEVTVGTDPWNCSGYWEVPEPWLTDNCSSDLDYRVVVWDGRAIQRNDGSWYVEGLPLGDNTVVIEASDACGNTTQHRIIVTAVDDSPPVAICKDRLQISLTGNQSPGTNYAAICAEDLDKASYDNCTEWIWYKTIRMDELLGTVNGSFADNTIACGGVNGDDDPVISGNQVYFDDCTKFCCDDADQVIQVVLRVHDVDPGAGPVSPARYTPPAGDLVGRFTDCWVEIEVVDKAQPLVVAPPDMVVSCMFWFDDSEAALEDINNPTFGRVVTSLNDRQKVKTLDIVCEEWCNDHPKYDYEPSRNRPAIAEQACNFYDAYYNDAHPDDKYELVWGFDGYAIQTCGVTPEIRVDDRRECGQGVILRDVIVTYQDAKTGGVVTFRDRQEIWVIDCDPFYVTEDCFDDDDCVEWPRFCQQPDPLEGCGADLDPYTNPDLGYPVIVNGCDDNCALIAVEYHDDFYTIEDSACFKVVRTWIIIDWCTYDPLATQTRDGDNPNQVSDGRWEFVQVIVVRDQIDPEVTVQVGDCEPAEEDANGVCHAHIDICAEATDDCSPDTWIVYDYKIDLYSDGTGQFGDFDVYVGKLTRDQYDAGQFLAQGPTDCVAYNQGGYCNDYADDPSQPFCASGTYPVGTHTIYWFAEDGCGNVYKHTEEFEVLDCKEPTPYCKTGIITVVMPQTGEICVWANDLNDGSFDNCTAAEDLKFYFNGDPNMTSYCVNCDSFVARGANTSFRVDVEMWVEDEEGNTDFCVTTIEFQDNQDVCDDSGTVAILNGYIKTEALDGVEGAEVDLMKNNGFVEMKQTDAEGKFDFGQVDMYNDYLITPKLDRDWDNGVSTKDLVFIQRHLLGKEEFTSPYQFVAADVNNTASVSAGDIAELRKFILGQYGDFSQWNDQTSWRFVDGEQTFADPRSPWPLDEAVEYKNVDDNMFDTDFVGVKVGDVTGDAQANGVMGNQTRDQKDLYLISEEEVMEGSYYVLKLHTEKAKSISGFQMTLNFDPEYVEYVDVIESEIGLGKANVGSLNASAGEIRISWNSIEGEVNLEEGTEVVALRFAIAGEPGKTNSDVFDLGNAPLISEAYDAHLETYDVKVKFGTDEATKAFALYQNVPNPFGSQTVIGYDLPEAMPIVLTIYDAYGKVALVKKADGKRGYNEVSVNSADLTESKGVLYYQLDASNYTATKRMVMQ